MTEQSKEKFVWIFEVEDCNYWGRTPDEVPEDFKEYRFLDGDTAHDMDMAQKLLWEHECSHADMKGEPDYEECGECSGEGCGDCGDEGGWQEDYSEFVQKNANGKLVAYDPTKHRAVKSGRPEHLEYARAKKLEGLQRTMDSADSQMEQMRKEMRRLGKLINEQKDRKLEAQLELAKLENE